MDMSPDNRPSSHQVKASTIFDQEPHHTATDVEKENKSNKASTSVKAKPKFSNKGIEKTSTNKNSSVPESAKVKQLTEEVNVLKSKLKEQAEKHLKDTLAQRLEKDDLIDKHDRSNSMKATSDIKDKRI